MTFDNANPLDGMLELTPKIAKLCQPLFDVSPITFYAYYEFHPDGRLCFLSSNKTFFRRYVEDVLDSWNAGNSEPGVNIRRFIEDHPRTGFFLRDLKPLARSIQFPILESLALGHACVFTDTIERSIVRIHYFLGRIDDEHINDFYFNNTNLLNYFSRYVAKKAQPLLEKVSPYHFSSGVELHHDWVNRLSASPNISIPKFLSDYAPHLALSRRQKEIIYWYLMGKTTEETAAILGITRNTINTHFDRLKLRFACKSKAQIIAELLKNGVFFRDLPENKYFL